MRPTELSKLLTFAIANKFNVLITGKPGIGKSDIVEQSAIAASNALEIFHPVVSDPTDFKGMPYVSKNGAEFLPFGDLKKLIDAKVPTVVLLDDVGQSPAAVQAALMQLLLTRRINGHKISDHVTFIAATNRKQDKAGVTGILEPVKSRFATIVELEVNTDDWVNWALTKGNMPIELVSFIRFRTELLSVDAPTKEIINSPSPRTVAHVGKLQNAGIPKGLEFEIFKGAAGEAFAAEYSAFLAIFNSLPNIDQILLTGDGDVPTEPAVQYAVSSVLASKISDTNCGNAFNYLTKLPVEIAVATVKDTVTRKPSLTNTKPFIMWAKDNGNILFN